jgi:hypothetical protein
MKETDVYLHYDTMSLRANAAILGLGAAFFRLDHESGPVESVYFTVSLCDQAVLGRSMDPATVEWWRTEAPYGRFPDPVWELRDAFARCLSLIEDACPDARIWVWNTMLEGAITQSLLDAFDVRAPWRYWNVVEGRTFVDIPSAYRGAMSPPAPSGISPQHQMEERVRLLRGAHAELAIAFDEAAVAPVRVLRTAGE